jgi:hypothetical protein
VRSWCHLASPPLFNCTISALSSSCILLLPRSEVTSFSHYGLFHICLSHNGWTHPFSLATLLRWLVLSFATMCYICSHSRSLSWVLGHPWSLAVLRTIQEGGNIKVSQNWEEGGGLGPQWIGDASSLIYDPPPPTLWLKLTSCSWALLEKPPIV